MSYEDLRKMGSHLQKKSHLGFSEHSIHEKRDTRPSRWSEHSATDAKKKLTWSTKNFKENYHKLKKVGHKFNKGMQQASKNVSHFEKSMGWTAQHTQRQAHQHTHGKPMGEHVYLHVIQEKGGKPKKKHTGYSSYDDYLNHNVFNRY